VGCAAVKFDWIQEIRLRHGGAMESLIDENPVNLRAALKRLG